eukprot:10183770-Alexandrium_andersonii.AAC.1
MSASLVGSEMCIRDRHRLRHPLGCTLQPGGGHGCAQRPRTTGHAPAPAHPAPQPADAARAGNALPDEAHGAL